MGTPPFRVISRKQAAPPTRRAERRDWSEAIDSLAAGKVLFFEEDHLSDQDVKYLQLAFTRRGKGERLTTQRTVIEGRAGRQLELRA